MAKNIVLIGFMGVGKGQVARSIAEQSSMFAVDCDDLIESMTNEKIKKIFANEGEAHFRKLERRCAKWLCESVSSTVISTGGGFLKVPNLAKIGKIVYLHADFHYILDKIMSHPNAKKKIKKRPLLQDMKSAEKLYLERLPLYKDVANLIVDVTNKSASQVAEEICRAFDVK